ncbi:dockerin type I domain-containing protein [Aeoliella sp. ICT_H6.2]|uniref:Dockerin type I domain-containing protein n=1 Tax=Aeoliella straminimaris TaxID=2954799 RepID=A0A9X2FDU3_9BACT|nr:dockerin type I domain-containing protein [Aeoliella straminimaris]MCO6047130.1 dockerin type I domain-containing protein [Aeoliella straminimaris]
MKRTSNSLSKFTVAIAALLGIGANSAQAIVLFSDTFDRPDNRNIDAVTTGITGTVGSTLPADGVYTQPFIDPANDPGPQDGDATNGGGAQIINQTLQLAVGAGTSNAYVNHNFIDSAILTDGGLSVSMVVAETEGASGNGGQGGGFAIGMSQAEADMAGDANGANGVSTFLGAFNSQANPISDFWIALKANNNLQWGGNGGSGIINVGADNGNVEVVFGIADFNSGSDVNFEIYYNDVSQGVGSFAWSGTNENYIGLDGRDNGYVAFDSFLIESASPPPVPTLTINRDTGNITLSNDTNQPLSMVVYSITTERGAFDLNQWETIEQQGLDTNDEWITLTDTSHPSGIASDISEGTLGEYTLGAAGTATDSIDLGEAWIRSPFEDLEFELRNANGDDIPFLIEYTGTELAFADYNDNGTVDALDWPTVRDNLISDVSELPPLERYLHGDLNNDGLVNQLDYRQFKNLYEADQGVGSFAVLLAGTSVPEPGAMVLLGLAVVGLAFRRVLQRVPKAALALVAIAAFAGQAQAVVLFSDTFDRPDNRNIDEVTTGITGTVGATLPADGVYTQPHLDPDWNDTGVVDGNGDNGGGTQILSQELQLAVGLGTSNAIVNHNFTNPDILSDGGFSVSLDVAGMTGTSNQQGGGFAIGMTEAEAASAGDARSLPADSPVMTSGLNGFTNNGDAVQDDVISDFWLTLRGNNTLAWGSNTGNVQGLDVGANTGTITATFAAPSFDAGQHVAYEVFFDGVSQGSGVFRWSDDAANYVGLDGRDGTAVRLDNFSIESTTEANINPLRLFVNTATGVVSLAGGDSENVLDFYEISSAGLGLVEGSYTGLQAAAGYPDGTVFGAGWELNGIQTSSLLSESYIGGSSTVSSGAAAASLGVIYNTTLDTRDLEFTFYDTDGTAYAGFVEYVSTTPSLPDFNGDGIVDIADYTVWRNHLGATGATLSQGDATGDGVVDAADYSEWKANFGAMAGSVAAVEGNASVPEPASLAILGLALTAGLICRRGK